MGPRLVIVANNSTVYVGMRSRLWRCSPEQLRAAHSAEEMGYHLASEGQLGELLRRVTSGTPAGAVNVAREGPPPEGAELHSVDGLPAGVDVPGVVMRPAEPAPALYLPLSALFKKLFQYPPDCYLFPILPVEHKAGFLKMKLRLQ